MTTTAKVLGQSNPAATTATTLYTVPGSTAATVYTLSVCNQAAAPATFRIAIRPAGAGLAAAHYIAYDTVVDQNDSAFFTLGIMLAATDVITVYGSTATLSFAAFGVETT